MLLIEVGRIETLAVDAVVNAANRRLLPGTGVDGALRAAAGPELTKMTQVLGGVEEGEAVRTAGFNLPAKHVLHTAAPVWFNDGDREAKKVRLADCYKSCIALANRHSLVSIGFPCLGTGNFGWPRDIACDIAVTACHQALPHAPSVQRIVFCCFTEADADVYRARLKAM